MKRKKKAIALKYDKKEPSENTKSKAIAMNKDKHKCNIMDLSTCSMAWN